MHTFIELPRKDQPARVFYLYRPALGFFTAIVTAAKRLQCGRLDAYLLYMLTALVAVIAVAAALA